MYNEPVNTGAQIYRAPEPETGDRNRAEFVPLSVAVLLLLVL